VSNKHFAWVLEVRPGYEEEYKKRHKEIWPEMIQMLKESGVRNYSIFRHGLTLFGYFETDNLENTIANVNRSEINRKWGEHMAPIMKIEIDPERNFPYLLPLQWHME
tara:strand:+ start:53 stop:373 length:321 start_codon:yes stop_codon:yes gene_type:complete